MSISVIIPSLNEEANIERAIRSVFAIADEVIVADGGSSDQTTLVAKTAGATVTSNKPGRGQQLRTGAALASGKLMLFMHADNWLSEAGGLQLKELATADSAMNPIFGCFRQRIDDPRMRFRILESGNAFRAKRLGTPYGDQAIFVDRESYDRVGGFAEVALMEDVILSQRLRKLTRPILLDGPVHLSARRWHSDGVLQRTIRNWFIFSAFQVGVSPQRLARWYG